MTIKECKKFVEFFKKMKSKKGTDFQFFVLEVLDTLNKYVELANQIESNNFEIIKDYELERNKICFKFSNKDEQGNSIFIKNPITSESEYFIIPEKKGEFENIMNELDLKYEKELKEYNKLQKEIDNKEVDCDLPIIDKNFMPKDLDGFELELLLQFTTVK